MTEDLSSNDIRQEGRLSAIEVKVERIHPLVEELHADMIERGQRYRAVQTMLKWVAWWIATGLAIIGLKNNNISVWLHATTGFEI